MRGNQKNGPLNHEFNPLLLYYFFCKKVENLKISYYFLFEKSSKNKNYNFFCKNMKKNMKILGRTKKFDPRFLLNFSKLAYLLSSSNSSAHLFCTPMFGSEWFEYGTTGTASWWWWWCIQISSYSAVPPLPHFFSFFFLSSHILCPLLFLLTSSFHLSPNFTNFTRPSNFVCLLVFKVLWTFKFFENFRKFLNISLNFEWV